MSNFDSDDIEWAAGPTDFSDFQYVSFIFSDNRPWWRRWWDKLLFRFRLPRMRSITLPNGEDFTLQYVGDGVFKIVDEE